MDGMATTTSALLFLIRPTELGVSAHVNIQVVASTLHYSCFSRAISHASACPECEQRLNDAELTPCRDVFSSFSSIDHLMKGKNCE
jgi:hypothetical protein